MSQTKEIAIQGFCYEYVATSAGYLGRKVYHLRQISGIGAGKIVDVSQWATRPDLWKCEANGCMMKATLMIDEATGKMVDVTDRVNMGEMKSAPNANYPDGVAWWYSKPTLDGVEV